MLVRCLILVSSLLVWSKVWADTCSSEDQEGVCVIDSNDNNSNSMTFGEKLVTRSVERMDQYPQLLREVTLPDAQSIEINNPNKKQFHQWWIDWTGKPHRKGRMPGLTTRSTNSYIGHTFRLTESSSNSEDAVFEFTVEKDRTMYTVPCKEEYGCDADFNQRLIEKSKFFKQYREQNGRPWLVHWPKDPPIIHMWDAVSVGYQRQRQSDQTHWYCARPQSSSNDNNNDNNISDEEWRDQIFSERTDDGVVLDLKDKCEWIQRKKEEESTDESSSSSSQVLPMTLETIAVTPRIFVIESLMSKDECELIKSLAYKQMKRSMAGNDGGYVSDTRTSQTTWLSKRVHPVVASLYDRTADLLGLTRERMETNAEHLQIVHYAQTQEYKAHYDFGAAGIAQSRAITLLFYLNDQDGPDAGGETGFPKAQLIDPRNNQTRVGFSVHPGMGHAVLFYDLLPDGNGDDATLHAGTPVLRGHKWICNFWIWDPSR